MKSDAYPASRHEEAAMARGDRRGNREHKKPKQEKPRAAPISPFATTFKEIAANQPPRAKKK